MIKSVVILFGSKPAMRLKDDSNNDTRLYSHRADSLNSRTILFCFIKAEYCSLAVEMRVFKRLTNSLYRSSRIVVFDRNLFHFL